MDALEALQTTLYGYLVGDNSRVWGRRVVPSEVAASGVDYPYVSFFWVGGGRELSVPSRKSARITLTVKGVCGEGENTPKAYQTALQMQGLLGDLLDASGEQDVPVNGSTAEFPTHSEWAFLTVTQGRIVYMAIPISDKKMTYHAGHQYEFLMERK